MSGELQRIVVLCFVAVASVGVYLFITQEKAEAPVQESVTPSETSIETAEQTSVPTTKTGRMIEVYDGISVDSGVTVLDLSGRQLEGSLKAEVRMLSNLEVLDLSNNLFTGLPAEVGQLSKLKVLNLANNQFTGLPRELGNLQNLETLDLRGNNPSNEDLTIIREALPATVVIIL